MPTDRRTLLAISGAFLAGMAGCVSESTDDAANSDDSGQPQNGDNGGDTDGSHEGDNGTGTDGENAGDNAGEDSFDDYDVPVFPRLNFVTEPAEVDDAHLVDQIRGNVEFTLDLLAHFRGENPTENVFYSPYSISVALAMTYAGARGKTAGEMAAALRFELDQDHLHPAFGALAAEFDRRNEDGETVEDPFGEESDEPGFQLETANSLWGQEDLSFEEDFLDLLAAYYGAGMELVDFQGSPEEARERINTWVEERTNERIEDLLPENSIDHSTRLVLVNAVYFLASWKYTFDEEETDQGTFTDVTGSESTVEMMHQSVEVPYVEIDGHQLVELPYANEQTSMVIIVPKAGTFEAFEANFSVDRLAIMLEQASRPEVDLTMPAFEVESEFSLVEAMEALGMERAFGAGADFSGMLEDGGLFIDDIRHKSFVSVDEQGTEAAAATAVVMAESGPADFVELTIDRPFLFYIRDRPTETPLFFGRIVDGEDL